MRFGEKIGFCFKKKYFFTKNFIFLSKFGKKVVFGVPKGFTQENGQNVFFRVFHQTIHDMITINEFWGGNWILFQEKIFFQQQFHFSVQNWPKIAFWSSKRDLRRMTQMLKNGLKWSKIA